MKCYEHNDIEATATCTECGKFICSDCMVDMGGKAVCKSCAAKAATRAQSAVAAAAVPAGSSRKDPAITAVLTFIGVIFPIFIGVGYIYLGQIKKGIALSVALVIAWFITAILCYFLIGCCIMPVLYAVAFYLVYDSYQTAVRMNNGEVLKDWFE